MAILPVPGGDMVVLGGPEIKYYSGTTFQRQRVLSKKIVGLGLTEIPSCQNQVQMRFHLLKPVGEAGGGS